MGVGVMQRRMDDHIKTVAVSVKERKQKALIKNIERTKNAYAARKESRVFHPDCTSLVASTEMQIRIMNQTVCTLRFLDE